MPDTADEFLKTVAAGTADKGARIANLALAPDTHQRSQDRYDRARGQMVGQGEAQPRRPLHEPLRRYGREDLAKTLPETVHVACPD